MKAQQAECAGEMSLNKTDKNNQHPLADNEIYPIPDTSSCTCIYT